MRKRTQMSLLVMTGLLSTGLGGCGTPKTQTAPETGNSESQSVSSSSIVKESHSVVDSSEDIILRKISKMQYLEFMICIFYKALILQTCCMEFVMIRIL